ncbi:CDGSH iron-sulfur domain-containing protein NEET [Quillaja saponaria]|uniref:CDGSH iron-sulfur domain-containing protein NEET n=1 Tax=Quillaja saponaria TaxID=32244 RepID=A0AAD7VH95_QUISA|nr:CDGSH iron-sulfur domain-containing protein NEET [Quillaja saponaria]
MASVVCGVGAGFCCYSKAEGLKQRGITGTQLNSFSFGAVNSRTPRRMMVVKAEAEAINPAIRKSEEKVVDAVVVTELSKPLTAYCRCWRSGTFPLCDGSHVKHNKANGDNVGPLLLKKQ